VQYLLVDSNIADGHGSVIYRAGRKGLYFLALAKAAAITATVCAVAIIVNIYGFTGGRDVKLPFKVVI